MPFTRIHGDNSVSFCLERRNGGGIAVAGSFSDWCGCAMEEVESGVWVYRTEPQSAETIEYKFIVNGHWITDPHNLSIDVDSGNSVLHVNDGRGNTFHSDFLSPALAGMKSYVVYLPSDYRFGSADTLPVLFLMGGLFDYELSWVRDGGIVPVLDAAIATGEISPLVVMMPDKDNHSFAEGDWDRYSAYLTRDVIGYCQTTFGCGGKQYLRAIEGLSLGGGWALRVTAQHPDLFGSAAVMSCGLPADVQPLVEENAATLREHVRFRFFCGTEEHGLVEHLSEIVEWMTELGITAEFCQDEGIHRWPLWQRGIRHSLRFHDFGFRRPL